MGIVAETATLAHGYTMAELDRTAGAAANRTGGMTALAFSDKYDAAWFAIVELLYESQSRPEWWDLFNAGRSAVLQATADEIRHHGYDRARGGTAPRFAAYWDSFETPDRPTQAGRARTSTFLDFTELLVEKMALPAALGALTDEQYQVVAARAATGSNAAAAASLGLSTPAFQRRLKSARERFMAVWLAPETPPNGRVGRGTSAQARRDGTCRYGHPRDEYSYHNGRQIVCRLCKRNSHRRSRARRDNSQIEEERRVDREAKAAKRAVVG